MSVDGVAGLLADEQSKQFGGALERAHVNATQRRVGYTSKRATVEGLALLSKIGCIADLIAENSSQTLSV